MLIRQVKHKPIYSSVSKMHKPVGPGSHKFVFVWVQSTTSHIIDSLWVAAELLQKKAELKIVMFLHRRRH